MAPAGAQFIHAAHGVTVADILEPAYVPPIVHSFFLFHSVGTPPLMTRDTHFYPN